MSTKSNNENIRRRQQIIPNNNTIQNSGEMNINGVVQVGSGSSANNVKINRANAGSRTTIIQSPPTLPNQSQATNFEVFFSYVDEDQKYVSNLQVHLIQLIKENVITNWYGSKLAAGSDSTESLQHFNQASLILLLISPDYIASDQRYDEVERAMERRTKEDTTVIPVLVRPAIHLRDTPLANLQPIPRSGKAISQHGNQETIFSEVAREIREVIESIKKDAG